jgi:formate dehydrogenase assembly factor FdhD
MSNNHDLNVIVHNAVDQLKGKLVKEIAEGQSLVRQSAGRYGLQAEDEVT